MNSIMSEWILGSWEVKGETGLKCFNSPETRTVKWIYCSEEGPQWMVHNATRYLIRPPWRGAHWRPGAAYWALAVRGPEWPSHLRERWQASPLSGRADMQNKCVNAFEGWVTGLSIALLKTIHFQGWLSRYEANRRPEQPDWTWLAIKRITPIWYAFFFFLQT